LVIANVQLPAETHDTWTDKICRPRLHVSPSGSFVVIANDFGRHGVVVRVADAKVMMVLDGGDNHPETVPSSIGFFTHNGRELLVHRTAWNRLDVSDLVTGELSTQRILPAHDDDTQGDRYLDYFHGRLFVSPDATLVVDDGWVWHPVGVPQIWNLHTWVASNVWESETGVLTSKSLQRAYYWNNAFCWLDNNRLAIEGIGHDDELMVPGCVVYEISDDGPVQLAMIPGPKKRYFGVRGELVSSDDDGMSVWDVDSEDHARTMFVPGFTPQYCDAERGLLVELINNQIRLLTL
jgi:hypothetical protein